MAEHRFPDGFLWGAATSAQQIEGGYGLDGRGESIWDRFAATPGNIEDGSDARVACDHYHRWREDVGLMEWLGLNAYRFSVAWPRVVPGGRGAVNPAGLDFYDALVDAAAGGRHPALRHALPLGPAPGAAGARRLGRARDGRTPSSSTPTRSRARLGDRVRDWVTHNEPWCIATLGHESGVHAPGPSRPGRGAARRRTTCCSRTAGRRRSCAATRRAPRSASCSCSRRSSRPPTAAWTCDAARRFDGMLQPLVPRSRCFRGRYPEDAIADRVRRGHLAGPELPFVRDGDLAAIAAPLDFLGVNYYSRTVVRGDAAGEPVGRARGPRGGADRHGLGGLPAGAARPAAAARARVPAAPDPRHRERGRLHRPGRRRRPHRRHAPHRVPARPPGRRRPGHRRRRAAGRLLRLVAARQLRVGPRLHEALRALRRGLRDAAPPPEGQRTLVSSSRRRERGGRTRPSNPCRGGSLELDPRRPAPAGPRAPRRRRAGRRPGPAAGGRPGAARRTAAPPARPRRRRRRGLAAPGRRPGLHGPRA